MKKFFKYIISAIIVAIIVVISFFLFKRFSMRLDSINERKEINTFYMESLTDKKENVVEKLREKYGNNEIIKFLEVTNTNIKYPVAFSGDNEFYLNHGYDKGYDINGALFIDEESLNSRNLIIYGHRMSSGTMFNELPKLLDKDKAKSSVIRLFDEYGNSKEFRVFSVFRVPADFDYRKCNFINDEDFALYVERLKDASEFDLERDLEGIGEILTLSTCTYEQKNFRLVVVCYPIGSWDRSYKERLWIIQKSEKYAKKY